MLIRPIRDTVKFLLEILSNLMIELLTGVEVRVQKKKPHTYTNRGATTMFASVTCLVFLMAGISLASGEKKSHTFARHHHTSWRNLARSRNFAIRTTWNGNCVQHEPVKISLAPAADGGMIIKILAPFFNSPGRPDGPAGQPFPQLWDYEVVEAFFLNDKDQYLEVELGPWGQHLLLMLNGERHAVKDKLPLTTYTATIEGDRWTGEAILPRDYFPPGVTKFNAYAIHGEGDDRVYESLYPATGGETKPDFHNLKYFQPLDISQLLNNYDPSYVSNLWKPYVGTGTIVG